MDKYKKYLLPRDISWMYFNKRILQEAQRDDVPLLNKVSFMGIYANNLEEFFRVRIASLKNIALYKDKAAHAESKEARIILKKIYKINDEYSHEYSHAIKELDKSLNNNNIYFLDENELNKEQIEYVKEYYKENIDGFIYPVWLSNIKKIIGEFDENFFMVVKMYDKNCKNIDYALMGLPYSGKKRFVELPSNEDNRYFIYIEDIIRNSLPTIFRETHFDKYEGYTFTFSKDAEMEIDNDINVDILQKIAKAVKTRKKGDPIRIIYDSKMPEDLIKKLLDKFNIDKLDTVKSGGRYQNYKDLIDFPKINQKAYYYPIWKPIYKADLYQSNSIIEAICERDRFIHTPYHSFNSFINLLKEASYSKNVKEIKISLYRLAKESKVVKSLINAARNGVKVVVVIELFARFDETSNINWSKMMQDAGIKVVFGVEGLKIHSKLLYINMNKGKDIACISSGNFHEGNSKVYTDIIFMTSNKCIVKEVKSVFEFIVKPYMPFNPKQLLVSPNKMKQRLLLLIDKEIYNQQAGLPAYIKAKINHITDDVIINKLYEASSKGVRIDLLVRGNCSIITGIKHISENIRIKGIIDNYLEHSRIYLFANGGDEKLFMGSSDWMPRNLDNRIEVVTPIYDSDIKNELKLIIDYGLRDNTHARIVDGTGDNIIERNKNDLPFRSQEELYKHYKEQ